MNEDYYFMSCENRNYHNDSRVRARRDAPEEPPAHGKFHWDVCPTCKGNGKHVNPSIDASGLTSEDFNDDPDFAEDYRSGMYDVTCYECHGKRVVPIDDDPEATKKEQMEEEGVVECIHCGGSGELDDGDSCCHCGGEGFIDYDSTYGD